MKFEGRLTDYSPNFKSTRPTVKIVVSAVLNKEMATDLYKLGGQMVIVTMAEKQIKTDLAGSKKEKAKDPLSPTKKPDTAKGSKGDAKK